VKTSVSVEIVGYSYSECSPFPCDDDRTCGLIACSPSGSLIKAYNALKEEISKEFGDCISVTLTLLDDGVPDRIKEIYSRDHPAIPMVLIQGSIMPIGRIALQPIRDAIYKVINT